MNASAEPGDDVRELVDSCLLNDDVTPLLKLIFTAGDGGASDTLIAFEDSASAVDELQQCLASVVADQDAVIHDVCAANAMDIAMCVTEMAAMHQDVQQLQGLVADGSQMLQAAGRALVSNVKELQNLLTVQRHVVAGLDVLRAARKVFGLCLEAGRLMESRQLYRAMQLVNSIRDDHLGALLSLLAGNGQTTAALAAAALVPPASGSGATSSGSAAAADKAAAGGTSPGLRTNLQGFFLGLVAELSAAVEQQSVAEFNDWLVSVRADARKVGFRAIRKAAISRALDEELSRERKQLVGQLIGGTNRDFHDLATQVASAKFRQELLREAAVAAAAPAVPPAPLAAAAPAAAAAEPVTRRRYRDRLKAPADDPTQQPPPVPAATAVTPPPLTALLADVTKLHVGDPARTIHAMLAAFHQGRPSPPPSTSSLLHASPRGDGRDDGGGGTATSARGVLPASSYSPPRYGVAAGAAGGAVVESDTAVGLLEGVAMQGLYRCLHLQGSLGPGHLESFQDYYVEQRRLQVRADLLPPHNFLEAYQGYLSQIVGFFIIEDAVSHVAAVLRPGSLASLWEEAAAQLHKTLDAALWRLDSTPILLLVKDYVLLLCDALGTAGFSAAPLEEVLVHSLGRYHEQLLAVAQAEVARRLDADALSGPLTVTTEAQLREVAAELGLPLQLEGAAAATGSSTKLPVEVPFTQSIPQLLQAARSYVSDSLSYLRGLYRPWELAAATRYHRDRMLNKVLCEALSAKTSSVSAASTLSECMWMVTNVWALIHALDTLDAWTTHQVRPPLEPLGGRLSSSNGSSAPLAPRYRKGAAAGGGESTMTGVQAGLRAVQDSAERAVLRLVAGRIEALVDTARKQDWTPSAPVAGQGNSAFVEELTTYLQETFASARAALPRSTLMFLCRSSVRTAARSLLRVLTAPDGLRAYNLFAIQRFQQDVAHLEAFVSRCPEPNLGQELAAPQQLCRVLTSGSLADVLVVESRVAVCPNVELTTLALALDKYQEIARVGKELTHFPTRKEVAAIAKQLRGQVMSMTGAGPRALEDV